MGVRDRRAVRPSLERVEGRELLSAIVALMATEAPPVPSAISVLNRRVAPNPAPIPGNLAPSAGFNAYSGNTGGSTAGSGLNNNTASPLLGNGFPSPQELSRETYHSAFSGRVYTGPGRFTSQGATYYYRGLGGSNFFLHGDFNMAIVTPTDPNAPFMGEAVMNDKSTNSSGIQGLILSGSRTAVDSQGRPTQLTFTADPNVYSGVFFVEAGQGTVNIKYGPNNTVHATFDGLIYTSGLTSPLVNQDLYARHGRPIPFHPTSNMSKVHNV